MTSYRYIELDSTYRDRTRFSNPANFEIHLSQSGNKTILNALDPVSESTPVNTFNNSFDAGGGATLTDGAAGGLLAPAAGSNGASSSNLTWNVLALSGDPIRIDNYYNGAVMVITQAAPAVGPIERRIVSYKFISDLGATDVFQVTFDQSLPDTMNPASAQTYNIFNPTNVTDTSNPQFFVPNSTVASNFYTGAILYNETRSQSRPIADFDAVTRLLTLDTSGTTTSTTGPVTGWAATDVVSIRNVSPMNSGSLAAFTNTTTLTLAAGASSIDDFYNGHYLRLTETTGAGIPPELRAAPINEIRRIIDYDGATRVATVIPGFSTTAAGLEYEVLGFSRDNVVNLNYTGSMVSQQESVCYEVELLNLILPNRVLNSGAGSRITFYPYLYVEFQNISSPSSGNKGIIYSNNPNSNKMLFRAAINDVPNPVVSPFIKINGSGAVQTIKFKPNDAMKFAVYLPNGELFTLKDEDTTSPMAPDPLIQISAMFAIKRLS